MKANKLTPRHAAPVQREINTTSSESVHAGLTPTDYWQGSGSAFAGDDAE